MTTQRPPGSSWLVPLLTAVAILLLGIFGRDPWKSDEAYTFGLVYQNLQTGDFLVPTLAGEPFVEKPPLFYWTAALLCRLFAPPLTLPDAARLASPLYVALAAVFVGLTSRRLNGAGWPAALLLLGTVGLLHQAHLLITDLAVLAGSALAFYGLALACAAPGRAGLFVGTGAGIAFMAKGLVGPALFLATAAGLPIASRLWRTRSYVRCLVVTMVAAAPWLLIWPTALYWRSPALFWEWLWTNNLGRFFGFQHLGPSMHPFYYVTLLPWYAWPIGALTLWSAWSESRDGWRSAALQLPAVGAISITVLLSLAHDRRDVYILPAFVPLAVLAARGLPGLPTRFLSRWRRASGIAFGVILGALWIGWLVQIVGWPEELAARINAVRPGFIPEFRPELVAVAVVVSLGFMYVIRQAVTTGADAAVHWTAGIAAMYGLAMTLWLPMANYAMSYRPTVTSLRAALPVEERCINSQSLGEPQRAFFHYLGGITTRRLEAGYPLDCDWILIQGRYDGAADGFPQPPGPNWQAVWESRRGGREVFILFRRTDKEGTSD